MAEIKFFATEEDCDEIWAFIFSELGMTSYPSPWFGELPVPVLATQSDVSANLHTYPRVAPALGYFLVSPLWSIEPLEFQLCKDNPNFAPFWFASQRYGGPSIHFIPRFGYPWHITPSQVVSGTFSDYPHYFSANNHHQIIERPAGLVTAMQAIRKKLRSLGKTVRAQSGEHAIGLKGALTAYNAGAVLRTGDIIFTPVTSRLRAKRR